jgi:hypothetical protein
MSTGERDGERFLSRWSRLKLEDRGRSGRERDEAAPASPPAPAADVADSAPAAPAATSGGERVDPVPELPSLESLTIESDYSAFFQPKVPEALRRSAVKRLFADPHFNVMDGLDVYIDDYGRPDPIPPSMLSALEHARGFLEQPGSAEAAEAGEGPAIVDSAAIASAGGDEPRSAGPGRPDPDASRAPAMLPRSDATGLPVAKSGDPTSAETTPEPATTPEDRA